MCRSAYVYRKESSATRSWASHCKQRGILTDVYGLIQRNRRTRRLLPRSVSRGDAAQALRLGLERRPKVVEEYRGPFHRRSFHAPMEGLSINGPVPVDLNPNWSRRSSLQAKRLASNWPTTHTTAIYIVQPEDIVLTTKIGRAHV